MKFASSWHKISAAMVTIFDWHAEGLEAAGLATPDTHASSKWVRVMSVQHYRKLSGAIEKELGASQVAMPADNVLILELSTLQVMGGHGAVQMSRRRQPR